MKQINMFDFIEDPYGKPDIGTEILILNKSGELVTAIVKAHCGHDYFFVISEHLIYGENFLHTTMRAQNITWFRRDYESIDEISRK